MYSCIPEESKCCCCSLSFLSPSPCCRCSITERLLPATVFAFHALPAGMLHSSWRQLVALCLPSSMPRGLIQIWCWLRDPSWCFAMVLTWKIAQDPIASCQNVPLGHFLQVASGPILLLQICVSSGAVPSFCLASLSLCALLGQPVP